jgi:hypothetical protein
LRYFWYFCHEKLKIRAVPYENPEFQVSIHCAYFLPRVIICRRTPVLEKASKAVWEIISGSDGLGKEITETVERVFFRLSGLAERPAAAALATTNELQEENGQLGEPSSSNRKRSFDEAELHESGGTDALMNGTGKRSATDSSEDSGAQMSENRST